MDTPEHDTIESSTQDRHQRLGSRRAVLVVHGPGAVRTVELGPGEEVVIGRLGDLAIADPSLSRRHARFSFDAAGVLVRDLGSRNGTHVRGVRVSEARLASGAAVSLGEVTITISVLSPGAPLLPGGIATEEHLFGRLEACCAAEAAFRRPFAVLYVRSLEPSLDVVSWLPEVRRCFRAEDTIAVYGRRVLAAVLPGASPAAARALARAVVDASAAPLAVGVAAHGHGPFERLDLARRMAARADEGLRVPLDDEQPEQDAPIVQSAQMKEVFALAQKVAASDLPVLILGETGVGKDVLAQAIHGASARADRPMRAVNCAAIADSLLEAHLFGSARGAFSGADQTRPGVFEAADGGTLFLDEVAELSPRAQAALLRVLETGRLRRVGGSDEIEVDVRILSATHADLDARVAEGSFREDLRFRLNPLVIHVPPLRERPEDLDALVSHFLTREAQIAGVPRPALDPEARARLRAHAWPGNVRELRNVILRALLLAGADAVIESRHLPPSVAEAGAPTADQALRARLERHEAELIREALVQARGNRREAAERLQIPVRTLAHKIQKLGIKEGYRAP